MLVWWILGVLAAFGAFCALWAAFGWLLPLWRGCALVCVCESGQDARQAAACYGWLHGLGLVKAPLLLVDTGLSDAERERLRHINPEFCTLEALPSRLEQERDRFD